MKSLKQLVIFCWLILGISSAHALDMDRAKAMLLTVDGEFLKLGIEIPFNQVWGGEEDTLRAMYRKATDQLSSERSKLGTGDTKIIQHELIKLHKDFRRIAVLVPFFTIRGTEQRDRVVERYLDNEDLLALAINLLNPGMSESPITEIWRYQGSLWVGIGRMSVVAAKGSGGTAGKCQELAKQLRNTQKWHVPNFAELIGVYAAMKNPQTNTAFGTAAAQWKEVWTDDQNQTNPGTYSFFHFQTEKPGAANGSSAYEVVCKGEDNPG